MATEKEILGRFTPMGEVEIMMRIRELLLSVSSGDPEMAKAVVEGITDRELSAITYGLCGVGRSDLVKKVARKF